jgi:hypothetical protein
MYLVISDYTTIPRPKRLHIQLLGQEAVVYQVRQVRQEARVLLDLKAMLVLQEVKDVLQQDLVFQLQVGVVVDHKIQDREELEVQEVVLV